MQTIENDQFLVEINELGATLHRIYDKKKKIDYLWDGNPSVWPKQAPNLFPSIGKTMDDHYLIDGKTYEMPHHGFVTEETFLPEKNTENRIAYSLKANERTKGFFPFDFKLTITYELVNNTLRLEHLVENKGDDFTFSLGAHPGFNVPINGTGTFTDYYLTFNKGEKLTQHEIAFHDTFPYRTGKIIPVEDFKEGKLPLTHEFFTKGLVILDESNHLNEVTLQSKADEHKITLSFPDFPQLCLWTKDIPEASFLCLEPFYGMPDVYGKEIDLFEKPGNCFLKGNSSRSFNTTITFE